MCVFSRPCSPELQKLSWSKPKGSNLKSALIRSYTLKPKYLHRLGPQMTMKYDPGRPHGPCALTLHVSGSTYITAWSPNTKWFLGILRKHNSHWAQCKPSIYWPTTWQAAECSSSGIVCEHHHSSAIQQDDNTVPSFPLFLAQSQGTKDPWWRHCESKVDPKGPLSRSHHQNSLLEIFSWENWLRGVPTVACALAIWGTVKF